MQAAALPLLLLLLLLLLLQPAPLTAQANGANMTDYYQDLRFGTPA
jgi:hypothetical protein